MIISYFDETGDDTPWLLACDQWKLSNLQEIHEITERTITGSHL